MKDPEKRTRGQMIYFMTASVKKLSNGGAAFLAQSPEFRAFLLFIARKAPKESKKILAKASRLSAELSKDADAQKKAQPKTARKRARPSQEELLRQFKRARTNDTEDNVDGESSSQAFASGGLRSQGTRDSSTRDVSPANAEDGDDEETDDGVELAQGLGNSEYEGEGENGQDDDEQIEGPGDGIQDDGPREGDPEGGEKKAEERQENEEGEGNPDVGGSQQGESREEAPLDNKSEEGEVREQSGKSDDQDLQDHPELGARKKNMEKSQAAIDREVVEYELELGLTRGDTTVVSWLRARSPMLITSQADFAFDMCTKLDFDVVLSALIEFHKNRRAEMRSPQEWGLVPSTCEMTNPDDIYNALRVTHGHTTIAKIYRAYGQMKLFNSINNEALRRNSTTYTKVLDEHALKNAGKVSAGEKKVKIGNYRDEYYGGCKWQGVASWFGGVGVVMVFIIAGIGSQIIAKGLRDDQRLALREISSYLKNIKKIVHVLGPNSLEDYCRNGHLSEEKIGELEGLEACFPEDEEGEAGNDDLEETDNDAKGDLGSDTEESG